MGLTLGFTSFDRQARFLVLPLASPRRFQSLVSIDGLTTMVSIDGLEPGLVPENFALARQ